MNIGQLTSLTIIKDRAFWRATSLSNVEAPWTRLTNLATIQSVAFSSSIGWIQLHPNTVNIGSSALPAGHGTIAPPSPPSPPSAPPPTAQVILSYHTCDVAIAGGLLVRASLHGAGGSLIDSIDFAPVGQDESGSVVFNVPTSMQVTTLRLNASSSSTNAWCAESMQLGGNRALSGGPATFTLDHSCSGSYPAAPCLAEAVWSVAPPALYCARVVTGSADTPPHPVDSRRGILDVGYDNPALGSAFEWVSTGQFWASGSTVLQVCQERPFTIRLRAPSTNGWTGSVWRSEDGGSSYGQPMVCAEGCTGSTSSAAAIVVDGDDDASDQATTQCLNGATCSLTFSACTNAVPQRPNTPTRPEVKTFRSSRPTRPGVPTPVCAAAPPPLFIYDPTRVTSYSAAVAYCVSRGYVIASIHSVAEADEVHEMMLDGYNGWRGAWLGGQSDGQGNWAWDDGTPWDYVRDSHQLQGRAETILVYTYGRGWQDYPAVHNDGACCGVVCRRAVASPPPPPSPPAAPPL